MNKNRYSFLIPVLALIFTGLAFQNSKGQNSSPQFTLRAGQSMYIVAFRMMREPVFDETSTRIVSYRDYFDADLGAERKVRTEIEKWRFFNVADKLSDANFVFLVNLDDSSIEGLAVPIEAYHKHYKEKFDLDALRDAAFGRCIAGPLKLPTISRLSERLIKDFREKLSGNPKKS
jgi:hypothetical protein